MGQCAAFATRGGPRAAGDAETASGTLDGKVETHGGARLDATGPGKKLGIAGTAFSAGPPEGGFIVVSEAKGRVGFLGAVTKHTLQASRAEVDEHEKGRGGDIEFPWEGILDAGAECGDMNVKAPLEAARR